MPAIAPPLKPDRWAVAAAAVLVDAGAPEVELLGDPEDEELEGASPGGVDSSGQF